MGWAARSNTRPRNKRRPFTPRGYEQSTHVRFRPLEKRDVPQVYRWFDRERRCFWLSPHVDLNWFRNLTEYKDVFPYAVIRGGFLAAFALLQWIDEEPGSLRLMVLVAPSQRRAGLGGVIVREMVKVVARNLPNAKTLKFGVFLDNAPGVALMAHVKTEFPSLVGPETSTAPDGRRVLSFALALSSSMTNDRARVVGAQR